MQVINARSVSEALSRGLHAIRIGGIQKPSRVGDVLVNKMPVLTVYSDPTNRVLFSPKRDANPFFHVMEALWMLAGRNDLPWLTRYNKRFSSYSDDGGATQPGAYGYRWRNYFGHDQLEDIIIELKQSPDTRRAVLAMWDGGARSSWADGADADGLQPGDFYAAVNGSNDVPCNTHAYFDTIDGRLNMTVCCRSNDVIWGAYGANAVHFSFLLEYMAARTGIPMGVYRQFSNNYHLYTNVVARDELMPLARDVENSDRYLEAETPGSAVRVPPQFALRKLPLVTKGMEDAFDSDLEAFMAGVGAGYEYSNTFFSGVAVPMEQAWAAHKFKDYDTALELASHIRSEDWRIACAEWLQRRKLKADVNRERFTEVVPTAQEVS